MKINNFILAISLFIISIILCSLAATSIAIKNSKNDNEGNNIYLWVYVVFLVAFLLMFLFVVYSIATSNGVPYINIDPPTS
jgi:tellurite resistance protein TehA-like permease